MSESGIDGFTILPRRPAPWGPKRRIRPVIGLVLILGAMAHGEIISQTKTSHQFKVLKDDPEEVAGKIVTLNGAHGQFSAGEGLQAGVGAEVLWGVGDRLQVQSQFLWYYLGIHEAGGFNHEFEAGAAYSLLRKTGPKEINIVLKHQQSKVGSNRITETEIIPTKALYLTQFKPRGGFYSKKTAVDVGKDPNTHVTSHTALGAYAGLEITSQAAIFTEVDGVKGVTSGYTRAYLDGILLPVSEYDDPGNASDPDKYGIRAGFAAYFNPVARNHSEYGKLAQYQMFPSIYFKSEAGIRGGEGWFFNLGIGLMLFRDK